MHGITNTGVKETTEFVRQLVQNYDAKYIEANAGTTYEDYVTKRGFFGVGIKAHTYAYHRLKSTPFRKALSKHIQKR